MQSFTQTLCVVYTYFWGLSLLGDAVKSAESEGFFGLAHDDDWLVSCFRSPWTVLWDLCWVGSNFGQRDRQKLILPTPVQVLTTWLSWRIDCTHIPVNAPSEHEFVCVLRKNFHSINMQVIWDVQMLGECGLDQLMTTNDILQTWWGWGTEW